MPLFLLLIRAGDGVGYINDAQRNLCLQHAPNSTVFQTNYLSHHITADTQAAFRNLPPQTAIMRAATSMSRTIDKRRPTYLTPVQQEEAHRHPRVQSLLRKKMDLKAAMKAAGRTVKSYEGSRVYEKYQEATRAYESEFKFQKKMLLNEIKRKFEKEQPIIDIQNQIHGMTIKEEEKDAALVGPEGLIPERVEVVDALFTFATSSPEEERKRRVRAINALVALGRIQDGYRYPVRREKRPPLMPVQRSGPQQLPLECKERQCFICFFNPKVPLDQRTKEFYSRGDLKKHLLRHVKKSRGKPIVCPHDRVALFGDQHVLNHAHRVHNTPTLLFK